jgi:NADH-quinone oxidoreductase E subunit
MLAKPITKELNAKKRAMLLSALYTAQDEHGWLSPEAIRSVAENLDLSPGQVYSTASFYTMFKLEPKGRYHVQVCEGLSCDLVGGADPVIDHLSNRLQIGPGETTPDGKFSLEVVQCLAACDLAPAIRVNDELYGNLSFTGLDDLLASLDEKEV